MSVLGATDADVLRQPRHLRAFAQLLAERLVALGAPSVTLFGDHEYDEIEIVAQDGNRWLEFVLDPDFGYRVNRTTESRSDLTYARWRNTSNG